MRTPTTSTPRTLTSPSCLTRAATRSLTELGIQKVADGKPLDENQREQLIKFAAFAASVGPVILVLGKLTKGLGVVTGGIGKFAATVGKAGGGFSGFLSVLGKSPSVWFAVAAAVITGTIALADYVSGARAIKESQDTVFDLTGTENICGRAGRFNLLSSGNRVINTTAEAPESLDLSGKSSASIIPEVTVIFAEQPDEQAVRDVLGMLMRERI